MDNKRIAYLGIDDFDHILYLSRLLLKLGKKVLVIDYSETGNLTRAVPVPVGLDPVNSVITNRKVDFTSMPVTEELLSKYDAVLAAYGFRDPEKEIGLYDRVVFVTDLYLRNIDQLNGMNLNLSDSTELYLLVKNVVDTKITPYSITGKLKYDVPAENRLSFYFEYQDYASAIICQGNQIARFTKISRIYRRFIIEDVMSIYPEYSRSVCKRAYRKARKGE